MGGSTGRPSTPLRITMVGLSRLDGQQFAGYSELLRRRIAVFVYPAGAVIHLRPDGEVCSRFSYKSLHSLPRMNHRVMVHRGPVGIDAPEHVPAFALLHPNKMVSLIATAEFDRLLNFPTGQMRLQLLLDNHPLPILDIVPLVRVHFQICTSCTPIKLPVQP
ncbi:CUN066 hypothetical protein [Culex nigripalpus nucleopolyhedrovirus]|uniref:Uncharacterized protein n=1 Tax=Culex nigripalpus nucleopolyhedrovirus (isolate Florida/1997) TaxID=645993 RepID=Q919L0_NPVCO|nr:CUN066 hypothetical protein [Culex nigripalpus nucleopolyhedrovirus]AAK94144.1 CUN066 hypothetical protein [Culex nigripalpus nucleopolyhedrovirus]